ncbi:polyprenyl synthetase family protein [Alkalicella caledoniensis]|uniref:Polyprenyl synthetase family protein n=1 Tax=Alkalicella caledoniensis TaxID=2731377 RepID=A0A7G9W9A7_ALKCA|nr:polyprenyl synthetase family protein [Alkalicella caledoniensis]QNO15269.1 polyprenyl synthetase family protein [Alkalicella caledoniensis]
MDTLADKVQSKVKEYVGHDLDLILEIYKEDKIMAKSFSIFTYLVAKGYGKDEIIAERIAEIMEAFFLATSIHDDIIDCEDKINEKLMDQKLNDRIVLGDYFFVELAVLMGKLTPHLKEDVRDKFLEYFTNEMLVVAKSQMIDQKMIKKKYSIQESLKQSEDRGGSWGRLVMGSVATACEANIKEVQLLTEAANNLFIALTILDDLQDLTDDIKNGIYSLAPSYYLDNHGDISLFNKVKDIKKIKKELQKNGAFKYTLETAKGYGAKASALLDQFLVDKEGMNWFQLKAFFGTIYKQLDALSDTTLVERF